MRHRPGQKGNVQEDLCGLAVRVLGGKSRKRLLSQKKGGVRGGE